MKENSRAYWNARATTFPRYENAEQNYETRMLDIIRMQGVDFKGKTVIDVGSGSGMYTIRLAKQAKQILAVDISDEMLRLLQEDAKSQNMHNITCVRTEWENFKTDKRFDIAFASMTPALKTDEDRAKIHALAREHVVFMGFSKRTPSDVMQGLYQHYKVTPKAFDNAERMRTWLEGRQISYQVEPVHEKWVKKRTWERISKICTDSLSVYGITPEEGFLREYLEQFKDANEEYTEQSEHYIEVITWSTL